MRRCWSAGVGKAFKDRVGKLGSWGVREVGKSGRNEEGRIQKIDYRRRNVRKFARVVYTNLNQPPSLKARQAEGTTGTQWNRNEVEIVLSQIALLQITFPGLRLSALVKQRHDDEYIVTL